MFAAGTVFDYLARISFLTSKTAKIVHRGSLLGTGPCSAAGFSSSASIADAGSIPEQGAVRSKNLRGKNHQEQWQVRDGRSFREQFVLPGRRRIGEKV